MTTRTRRALGTLAAGVMLSGVAQAALYDRGGGLIYDSVLDVTWLQDANYAKTSGYDSDGLMNWNAAMTWAANLSYYDSVRDVTWDDWRLPTALNQDGTGPCSGYNCTGSELGHMFYNYLGGNATESVLTTTGDTEQEIANLLLFGGTQSGNTVTGGSIQSSVYWSGTEFAPNPSKALYFAAFYGHQDPDGKGLGYYAWAVRDGYLPPIPVPAALPLFLTALASFGLLGARRRG